MVCYWELARSDCTAATMVHCHSTETRRENSSGGGAAARAGRHLPSREAVDTDRNTRKTQRRGTSSSGRQLYCTSNFPFLLKLGISAVHNGGSLVRYCCTAPALPPAPVARSPSSIAQWANCDPLAGSLSTPTRRHMFLDNSERSLM